MSHLVLLIADIRHPVMVIDDKSKLAIVPIVPNAPHLSLSPFPLGAPFLTGCVLLCGGRTEEETDPGFKQGV